LQQPLAVSFGERAAQTEKPEPIVFTSNWSREEFEAAVERVQEHIRRGDCYQAVLSQRLSANITVEPFEIYRALRRMNPAPYMYFLQLGDAAIIGASPEMLVRARGRELTYRPIAGTRPRGTTIAEDKRLADELKSDAKEVAEHAMLVDLGRNDLGRVAEYGSVRVERLMTIEGYAHVQHLVSELSATLRVDAQALDALAACFPAGTVTGAPKLRAMNLINELEPDRRGTYAGAILYHDYAGNLDSCIAIRTIYAEGGQASVQAGAGIVFDSIPSHEYEETMNKARAMMRAIEKAENSG
jgi:anthranilate synthase component 1